MTSTVPAVADRRESRFIARSAGALARSNNIVPVVVLKSGSAGGRFGCRRRRIVDPASAGMESVIEAVRRRGSSHGAVCLRAESLMTPPGTN